MRFGVVFPQLEFGHDPGALREYAQTAEALGYTHLLAYDHVLGANPKRPGGWKGPYTHENPFLEPFVLFSFLAQLTKRLEFTTGILILPQRQTALVAKQAATLDVLSGGRLRLGVGLGWNEVEYQALGEKFSNRGRRIEEQIKVLQRLWAEPLVKFEGRWHQIPDAGLNPLPVNRKIPIWFGGHHENVLKRVAKYGDGWMPNYRKAADVQPHLELLDKFLETQGKKRSDIGLEARIQFGDGDPNAWRQTLEEWKAVDATHITINTMGVGLDTPQKHIDAIKKFAKEMGMGK
ncbi:MAG: LLM class F420-dependent oxidoreductase [Chloroflexi bacterium]|nr:LLM class F420-dependent oxidoreductase [Chloroflexota bacterium]